MRNNLKKVAAAFAAAVMCAVPTVSSLTASAASSTERYTFRTVYYANQHQNDAINLIVNSWGMNSNGTSAPTIHKVADGRYVNGGGGAPNHHHAGVNFYPSNKNLTGIIFTQHVYSDYNTLTSNNINIYAYKADGTAVNYAVGHTDSFLVGDLNGDNKITWADEKIVASAASSNMPSYLIDTPVYTRYGAYPAYQLDINNDGKINDADDTMIYNYIKYGQKIPM